jgi:hypothetical protein
MFLPEVTVVDTIDNGMGALGCRVLAKAAKEITTVNASAPYPAAKCLKPTLDKEESKRHAQLESNCKAYAYYIYKDIFKCTKLMLSNDLMSENLKL